MNRTFALALGLTLWPILAAVSAFANDGARPNILLILVDDLGKEWIGAYGADAIATPNIDALAAGGMRFTNAYSMPQCTPSRVTLLTGKYPYHTGWVNHWDVPRWGVGYFDWKQKENTTVATLLRNLGYATCAAGKWQINDFRIEPRAMDKHGFDDWAMWTGFETGNPASAERYQDPYINTPEGSRTHTGGFGPDLYADRLIAFMEAHHESPMFLYFPMALTHTPLIPTPDEPEASGPLERHKAMVRYTDKIVGRLIDALRRLGIHDRTVVIFTTDNGSTRKITGERHGLRIQGAKGTKEEAGICAPFLVYGPGLVPAGVTTDALTDFTDLLPTFVDLAGGSVPEALEVDGISIAPLILGRARDTPRAWILAMGHGPARLDDRGVRGQDDFAGRVIRDKRFKAWISPKREIFRLHDLKLDPFEEVNLLDSPAPAHRDAHRKFQAVLDRMPDRDARPSYAPRAPNPWDR